MKSIFISQRSCDNFTHYFGRSAIDGENTAGRKEIGDHILIHVAVAAPKLLHFRNKLSFHSNVG